MADFLKSRENPVFGKNWQDTVIRQAGLMGVAVLPDQARMMAFHAEELLYWNRKINLTSITDPLDMALNHYVDSLAISSMVGETDRILDMGSGGGFPGIPLKIHKPSLKLLMVDASRKKVSFLKHVCRILRLEDIEVLQSRAESLVDSETCAHGFDVVVSRAFSSLEKFFTLSRRLILPNGKLIAMKGILPNKEIEKLQSAVNERLKNHFTIKFTTYQLPLSQAQRSVIRITHCR